MKVTRDAKKCEPGGDLKISTEGRKILIKDLEEVVAKG